LPLLQEHIFRLEQEVYAKEGVIVPATAFKDNKPTLNLLEDKMTGVFSMIDEEINVPKGSDDGYLNKVKTKHGKNENFIVPKPGKGIKDDAKCFGIKHYAGDVYYNVTNFLEKNKDTLHNDLISAVQSSNSPFFQELFQNNGGAAGGRRGATGKSAKVTLGAQFKTQLSSLMDTLNSTFPHFVRCMKPNPEKRGSIFESNMMLAQLRYAGLLEVCRIRKLGYPIRREFDLFFKRYKIIVPEAITSIDHLLQRLQELGKLQPDMFAKGFTKVFLKNEQAQALEVAREQALVTVTVTIQSAARGHLARRRYKAWKKTMDKLREATASRNRQELDQWLDMAAELPHGGAHLAVVKTAKALKQRLDEEIRIISLLEGAIKRRDISGLRAALEAADHMSPPLANDVTDTARKTVALLEREAEVKAALLAAIEKRDKSRLIEVLQVASSIGVEGDEKVQGEMLLKRLQDEEEVAHKLLEAVASRNIDLLVAMMSKASEMGLDTPEVAKGRALKKEMEIQIAAKNSLIHAIKQRDKADIEAALEKAAHAGLDDNLTEVAQGRKLVDLIDREIAATAALAAAIKSRNLPALEAAVNDARELDLINASEFKNAQAICDKLFNESRCREQLVAATEANSDSMLAAALAEATRMGLTGPEVDAARAASQKLGQQSAARTKMSLLVTSTDLAAIKEALAEAEELGLEFSPEGISLQERMKLLELESQALEELLAAIAASSIVVSDL